MGRSGELEVCKEVETDMQRAFPVSPGGRSRCRVLGFRKSWGTRGVLGRASRGTREQQGRMSWMTGGVQGKVSRES